MEKLRERTIKIVSPTSNPIDAQIYDEDGSDLLEKIAVTKVEIIMEPDSENRAILTVIPKCEIHAKATFQYEDGRPIIDLFKTLKKWISEYKEYNENLDDGWHTDCLDDFYDFVVETEKNSF